MLGEDIKKPEKRPVEYNEIFEYLMKIKEWFVYVICGFCPLKLIFINFKFNEHKYMIDIKVRG
jgi:hypothetical protein